MQLSKHNVETPPQSKPNWLRKTVAAIAALATLATGGLVASTAYAADDTGGGGVAGGGPTGSDGSSHLEWVYKDDGTGWGPASDWNSTKAAMTAMGWHNLDDSQGGSSVAWMQQATAQANANCISRVKSKYPNAPDDPNMCRVVGVGAIGTPGKQFGYGAGASHNEYWMKYWHQVVDGRNFNNGSVNYHTSDAFTVDPSLSVDKIADRWAPDFVNGQTTGTLVVVALSRYEPVPQSFQPTVTTKSAKRFKPGEEITDQITSGVSDGTQWISGTSVKAKGYYYNGEAANILKQINPNNGESVQDYLNRVKSAGGSPLATSEVTFTDSNQTKTVKTGIKSPANATFGTWVWVIEKNAQADQNKIKADYIDAYGKTNETSSLSRPATVWSEVAEPHASKGASAWDVMHFSGLPKDFGKYKGNTAYDMAADDTKFTVDVWWAGSGTNNASEDLKYVPTTAEEPTEDANHKKVGSYTYDMQKMIDSKGIGFDGNLDIKILGGADGYATTDGKHPTLTADKSGYYVFILKYANNANSRVIMKNPNTGEEISQTAYNDQFERTLITPEDIPKLMINTSVSASEVKPGEKFHDVAKIFGISNDKGMVSDGAYVTFDAYNPVQGNPNTSAGKLLDGSNAGKVALTAAQIKELQGGNAIEVTSPDVSTNTAGKVYWRATLYDKNNNVLATHALGVENETVLVKSYSITTKVNDPYAYVGQNSSDTATIQGKVQTGDFVRFKAYDADGTTELWSEDKAITADQIAKSDWGKTFDVTSGNHRVEKKDKIQWKASLMRDTDVLATHNLGIASETVYPQVPPLTTTATTSATIGEKFGDTATVSGFVEQGAYVVFEAYNPVTGKPDTGAGKLLTGDKHVITAAQSAESAKGTPVEIKSSEITANNGGNVYWQATLFDKNGVQLSTHALGIDSETTRVTPPTITTQVSSGSVTANQKFHDVAKLTGKLQKGWYVEFTAYKPQEGAWDANGAQAIDGFPQQVAITDANVTASEKGNPVTIESKDTSVSDTGNVYWRAQLKNAQGNVISEHEMGIASETTVVKPHTITTQVSKSSVYSDETFQDVATVTGVLKEGWKVHFTAYQPQEGAWNPDEAQVLYEKDVPVTAEQVTASSKGKETTFESGVTSTQKIGKVYWKAQLIRDDNTVAAEHKVGIASETTEIKKHTITTQVSKGEVSADEKFHDTAVVTGYLQKGWYVDFVAYDAQPGKFSDKGATQLGHTKYVFSDAEIKQSQSGEQVKVSSDEVSTKSGGNVYWQAELRRADNSVAATHEVGISSETTVVQGPEITTQESTQGRGTQPGEKFHDVATVKSSNSGVLDEDWYVEFTAYDAVQGEPNTINDKSAKILDRQKVKLSDANAVTISADKKTATVKSQDVSTNNSGNVYWMAKLYGADGTLLASHVLGDPSETTPINPGGIITSHAQTMGAVGEQLYDEITVYDETPAAESADGKDHKGNGSGNTAGFGHIPTGSYVTVEMFRQETSDGNKGQRKNLVATQNFNIDVSKFKAIKEGQTDTRPGYYTFKATGEKFKATTAGQYWWKSTLYSPTGHILDAHEYGETVGDQHETGYDSQERTSVQKFSTTVSKKWLSVNDDEYASGANDGKDPEGGKTLQVYDVLHQIGYEQFKDSGYSQGLTGQTADGAKYTFEIWSKDGAKAGQKVQTLGTYDLPKLQENIKGSQEDDDVQYGQDNTDNRQNVKSETVTVPADWDASKYYFRVKITVPTASTTGIGTNGDSQDVVWYGGTSGKYTQDAAKDGGFGAAANNGLTYNTTNLGFDENEAFDVIKLKTQSTEKLWVTPQQENITDDIELWGNIPSGSQYEVEIWKLDKDTEQADATATTKVSTTDRQDVPAKAIGAHLNGVTFRSVEMKNPGVGSYQYRVKFYSPEVPHKDGAGVGTGGDTTMNAATGVITEEWMKAAGGSTEKGYNSGDYWEQANAKQKGNGDGYSDRWLLFDGKTVAKERFEIVKITTDVTKSAVNNYQSVGDQHYVDVTKGKEVSDHVIIDGHMLPGYKIKYELWRKDNANHRITDEYAYSDAKNDVVKYNVQHVLKSGQATDEVDAYKLFESGDYYWTYDFTKPDNSEKHLAGGAGDNGQLFQPQNNAHVYSNRNIKSESFHAIRITTAAYRWTVKNEKAHDTVRIEGWLDPKSQIVFNLMNYDAENTAESAASTKSKSVEDLKSSEGKAFDKDAYDQQLDSDDVVVPDAIDFYWSEVVTLPTNEQVFHRGDKNEPSESIRSVDAKTDTATEYFQGTQLQDHSVLTNINYDSAIRTYAEGSYQAGLDSQEHTEKFKDGELRSTWRLYKQAAGEDASKDELIAVLNGKDAPEEVSKGIQSDEDAVVLKQGIKEASSAKWDTSKAELGDYYWVNVIWNATDNKVIQTGKSRDPRESFAVIKADSEAQVERGVKQTLQDTVTIYGPVKEGTMVSWKLYRRTIQPRDADEETQASNGMELAANFDTPSHGAVLITAEQAKEAKETGKVTVKSPESDRAQVGEYHWVFALTAPKKNIDPTTYEGDGTIVKPVKDDNDMYTTAHLDDFDKSTPDTLDPFFEDLAYEPHEVTQVINAVSKAQKYAYINKDFYDTVMFEGHVVKGTQVEWDLYKQADDEGTSDVSKDTKILTTDRVVLGDGQMTVESPKVQVKEVGTYYWVHRVYSPVEHQLIDGEEEQQPEYKEETVFGHFFRAIGSFFGLTDDKNNSATDDSKDDEIPVLDDPILEGLQRDPEETTWVFKIYTKAEPLQEAGTVLYDTAYIEGPVQEGMRVYFQLFKQDKGSDYMKDELVGTTGFMTLHKDQHKLVSTGIKSSDKAANYYWRESLYPPENPDEPSCPPDDHGNPPCGDEGSDKPCNPCDVHDCPVTPDEPNKPSNPDCDNPKGDCVPPCDEGSKDTDGDGKNDTNSKGKTCLPKCDKGENGGGTGTGSDTCAPDTDNDGKNDNCEGVKPPCEGTCYPPLNVEKPRVPDESTHTIKVTTNAQQTSARVGDLVQDKAIISGDMIDGYEVVFEAWKQADGNDVSKDKLVFTSNAVSVSAGAKEVLSPKYSVGETGTYYWREKVLKKSDKKQITYGAPRVKEETFVVKEKLAMTGIDSAVLVGIAALLMLVAGAASSVLRKRN